MSCCSTAEEKEEAYDLTTRIDPDEKRLINCNAVDVNQLMPLKYTWAWEHYNNWLCQPLDAL